MTAVSGSDPDGYVLEEDELPAIGQGWDANRVSGGEFDYLCILSTLSDANRVSGGEFMFEK